MQYITSIERMGIRKGRQEGRQEGRREGFVQGKREDALAMLKEGLRADLIARITHLPLAEIEQLKDKNRLAGSK